MRVPLRGWNATVAQGAHDFLPVFLSRTVASFGRHHLLGQSSLDSSTHGSFPSNSIGSTDFVAFDFVIWS
jgi:hypothetical protein